MTSTNDDQIITALKNATQTIKDPADRLIPTLDEATVDSLAVQFGCTRAEVHILALKQGIWPHRYIRNQASLSSADQIRLAQSRVAVVGCGGLGGTVIALLARSGIGSLTIVDSDVFDETNLNRQLVSGIANLGQSKSKAAGKMVAGINPAVNTTCHAERIDTQNAMDLLSGSEVLVDALDNIPGRFVLDAAARQLGIPMVHGALAGFNGQVMTFFPEDPGIKVLYGEKRPAADDPKRAEAVLGVPALTPSAVATVQAMEVVKIILKRGQLLRNRMLHIDLEASRYEVFNF